jgi:hypothetical protein
MRVHFADYFTCPNVMAVLVVSLKEETLQAAAILWTRQANGAIVVSQAVDFGVAPLDAVHCADAHFHEPALDHRALPAVPPGTWVRFVAG